MGVTAFTLSDLAGIPARLSSFFFAAIPTLELFPDGGSVLTLVISGLLFSPLACSAGFSAVSSDGVTERVLRILLDVVIPEFFAMAGSRTPPILTTWVRVIVTMGSELI